MTNGNSITNWDKKREKMISKSSGLSRISESSPL
jgi:hypothetical protein